MIAYLNLRYMDDARAQMFRSGLQSLGYKINHALTNNPQSHDILVTWNRIGAADQSANAFESAGCPVIVTENASWGNSFAGQQWYHLALNRHNEFGRYPVGADNRWDNLEMPLLPWRDANGETVILHQRGIGAPGYAAPYNWHQGFSGRIRQHPGQRTDGIPLELDLAKTSHVITWGSGAAIKALMLGIKVTSVMPSWIGEQDNTYMGRVAMLRRLAWGQWRHEEIESGEAFYWLLETNQYAH